MQDDEAFVRIYISKYDSLWEYIGKCGEREITLTYDEIAKICGVPILSLIHISEPTRP